MRGWRRILAGLSRAMGRAERTQLGGDRGSQLLEVALVLPLLLILAVGILDFGTAYNLKQILNNAAREGARMASGTDNRDALSSGGCGSGTTTGSVRDDVVTYLQNANVNMSAFAIPTGGTWSAPGTCSYLCTTGACGGKSNTTYGLVIERLIAVNSNGTNVPSTRVTLTYPYSWLYGFNNVIGFFGAKYATTVPLSTNAVMANLN
jgi:TadE-like protein